MDQLRSSFLYHHSSSKEQRVLDAEHVVMQEDLQTRRRSHIRRFVTLQDVIWADYRAPALWKCDFIYQ